MAEEGKKAAEFSLPSAGLLALAVATLGLILTGPSPLIGERPASHTLAEVDKGRVQDVDARMWQDPLGAVLRDKKRHEKPGSAAQAHEPQDTINRAFADDNKVKRVLVLAAMIPGGPYPEEEESRRRQRYALLSAVATEHYAPVETEHIGYFRASTERCKAGIGKCPSYELEIPFEVFSNTGPDSGSGGRAVVVLWLDDTHFDKKIRYRIDYALHNKVSFKGKNGKLTVTYAVIGPNRSEQLQELVSEEKKALSDKSEPAKTNPKVPAPADFYAAGATASDRVIGSTDETKKIIRTIGNDEQVATALREELKLRQIDPVTDSVLLISEWDSLYGRLLPDTFARAYKNSNDGKCEPLQLTRDAAIVAHVYCVSYMRGIDGVLPRQAEKSEPAQDPKKPEPIQLNANIDRPSGTPQKDYLRRLVDEVRKLDQEVTDREFPSPVKNNGIAAIGILGFDVYDKLMILQALRPYFPGKIFFTTDMDAAFFTPQEQPYTHNLIIGSSYGLSLAPKLQGAIPPFRDSYQTATFLSAKLAISRWTYGDKTAKGEAGVAGSPSKKVEQLLETPRIFEIGRNGPVDLSAYTSKPDRQAAADCPKNVLECESIHPRPDIGHGAPGTTHALYLKVIALLSGLLLLYRLNWKSRKLSGELDDWMRVRFLGELGGELAAMVPILLAGLALGAGLSRYVMTIGKEEPFYWLNGVSIWPSHLLQLSALILAIWSLFKVNNMMRKADRDIWKAFLFVQGAGHAAHPAAGPTRIVNALAVHKWDLAAPRGGKINVRLLWRQYLRYGARRCSRAVMNMLIFLPFGFAAIMLSGGLPVPARGRPAFYGDVVLEILCVVAVILLIMWVVDSARLASKLIEQIAKEPQTDWPGIREWGWPHAEHRDVSRWMDVQFVAKYTKAIQNFVWFPIPPMLLLGVARSSVFDNWTFSAGLFASIGILLCYLFSVVLLLERGAKDMRRKAVDALDASLKKLRGQTAGEEKKHAQLEKMIAEIKANEEGAFMPFMRQPMVQALLALLSGSGGIAVLLQHPFF